MKRDIQEKGHQKNSPRETKQRSSKHQRAVMKKNVLHLPINERRLCGRGGIYHLIESI